MENLKNTHGQRSRLTKYEEDDDDKRTDLLVTAGCCFNYNKCLVGYSFL